MGNVGLSTTRSANLTLDIDGNECNARATASHAGGAARPSQLLAANEIRFGHEKNQQLLHLNK